MSKSEPKPAKICVESDSVIRLEADFGDPSSCFLAVELLFLEVRRRHGVAAAHDGARAIAWSDQVVNNARSCL